MERICLVAVGPSILGIIKSIKITSYNDEENDEGGVRAGVVSGWVPPPPAPPPPPPATPPPPVSIAATAFAAAAAIKLSLIFATATTPSFASSHV